jgi:YfiH family protein
MMIQHPGLAGTRHGFFTRKGGVSEGGFASLNCSDRSADEPARVAENRARAAGALGFAPEALVAVHQVHGVAVAVCDAPWESRPVADALVTARPGLLLGIVTADCGPVLFADERAGVVGAAHAGWRGAVAGVLEATLDAMRALGAHNITAVVGPCIAQPSYEVGADLRDAVLARDAADASFFAEGRRADHWQFDLPGYCVARLRAAGAEAHATFDDTLAEPEKFFSHRRRTLGAEGPIGHQLSAIGI